MGYWPSYSDISPECREGYLDWLASGRSDPDAYIGYVFLFFYGLERRLLVDLRHLQSHEHEAPALIAEVERLLEIYGGNGSFRMYAANLLQFARALWPNEPAYTREPSFVTGPDLPIEVRIAVGELVMAEQPIPGKWAMAWVMGHPETRLRKSAKRCRAEFESLFLKRFEEKYGSGIKLKPNKRRLRVSYRGASAGIRDRVELDLDHLPDIATLSRPLGPLRAIIETVESELDGYSRYLGRNPNGANSIEALALLPRELARTRRSPEIERLREWAEAELSASPTHAVTSGAKLMEFWSCADRNRMSKREAGGFAKLLDSLGYGIEPDPRFGGGAIDERQKVILFTPGADENATPSSYAIDKPMRGLSPSTA